MKFDSAELDLERIGLGLTAVAHGDWAGAAAWWPLVLAEALRAVDSPAEPGSVGLAEVDRARLTDLAAAWPGLGPDRRGRALTDLADRLLRVAYATRPHCLGCGRCCRAGSPALLAREADLVGPGGPFWGQVYAVRIGEPMADLRRGETRPAARERIKLREDRNGCLFLDPAGGCRVYEHRPAQCRALECWRPESSLSTEHEPLLDRPTALAGRRVALDYLAAHQARCPADDLIDLSTRAETDRAARDRLIDQIGFDGHVRRFALEKGDLEADELNLVLGRPLEVVLIGLGWRLDPGPDRPRLVRLSEGRP